MHIVKYIKLKRKGRLRTMQGMEGFDKKWLKQNGDYAQRQEPSTHHVRKKETEKTKSPSNI